MLKKLKHFSELVAFEHTIFSASFILIAMIVASKEVNDSIFMGWKLFLLCVVALVSARNFAMSFNRFVDMDIDSKNKRTKNRPSVDGRISKGYLISFIVLNCVIFIITSFFINDLAFYLSFPFLLILGGYSLFKRFSSLAHLILGISLGLAPIAGVIAVAGSVPLWSVYLALGVAFWVAGFDVLYSLQDVKVDRKLNLFSIPSRFGVKNAIRFSRVFHILAVLLWVAFVVESKLGNLAWLGVLISACMLVYEQYLVAKSFNNIPKAFFVTNGYLGFILLFFILMDRL